MKSAVRVALLRMTKLTSNLLYKFPRDVTKSQTHPKQSRHREILVKYYVISLIRSTI